MDLRAQPLEQEKSKDRWEKIPDAIYISTDFKRNLTKLQVNRKVLFNKLLLTVSPTAWDSF